MTDNQYTRLEYRDGTYHLPCPGWVLTADAQEFWFQPAQAGQYIPDPSASPAQILAWAETLGGCPADSLESLRAFVRGFGEGTLAD